MKHEQITVDYWTMLKSSCTYLAVIFAGWVLIKLIMAVFWFPSYLQKCDKRFNKDDSAMTDDRANMPSEELKKEN